MGLLHQGTLQPAKVPADFGAVFARHLSETVIEMKQDEVEKLLMPAAEKLAAQKYGAPSWLAERSVAEVKA